MAARDQNAQNLPPKKRVYATPVTEKSYEPVQGGKLLTSPMVLSNGSTVYTAGYQAPLQGMAYVPIHTGQQVQQFTSAQGHPINQGVLKFQTVTKSPYGNKGGVQAPTKIHMTSPASQRSISDNQITTTIRNKNIQTPVCYVQTKLDHSEIKEYKPSSIMMTNTAVPGPVKVSSGAIYRAVPSSHFSRPGLEHPDNVTPDRKVKTINRNAFKNDIQTSQTSHAQNNIKGEYKENYCQIYSNGSSNSISMSTSTEYFEKGSLIALEDGQCKKIEDLKKEDFLLSGNQAADKRVITSVLTEIKRNDRNRHGEEYVNLHFRICETGQKVEVAAPVDHPYFTKTGWASIDPRLTEKRYRLSCRPLQIDDEIFSLEKENSVKKVVDQHPQASMGEMSGPNITKLHSPASAFRPIQNEKPSNGKELLSSRLQHDRANLSPKRQRRKSETDLEELLRKREKH